MENELFSVPRRARTNILENFQALLVDFSRLLHNTKTPLRRYELLARLISLTLSRYQYV